MNVWELFQSEKEEVANLLDEVFRRAYTAAGGTEFGASAEDWDIHWRINDDINLVALEVLNEPEPMFEIWDRSLEYKIPISK